MHDIEHEKDWETVFVKNYPYQGAYFDISRRFDQPISSTLKPSGVPRTSIFEDVAYYWTKRADPKQIYDAQGDPVKSTIFLKTIIAVHWVSTFGYLKKTIYRLEDELEENGKHKPMAPHILKNVATELQFWRRRLFHYCEDRHKLR